MLAIKEMTDAWMDRRNRVRQAIRWICQCQSVKRDNARDT